MATKLYEMIIQIRVRVEADAKAEARSEAMGIIDQIARSLPTGASIKVADPASVKII